MCAVRLPPTATTTLARANATSSTRVSNVRNARFALILFYFNHLCKSLQDGHGDIENGCPACACNGTGSTQATHCDEVSGQCACKPGVFGKHCDSCRTGYFNFTHRGCQCMNNSANSLHHSLTYNHRCFRTKSLREVNMENIEGINKTQSTLDRVGGGKK
jgi:hypothetical protein